MARYIDANKLKSKFLENYNLLTDIIREQNDNGAIIGVSELIGNIINNTPTADVQEVKHGKWVEDNDGVTRCSNCGEKANRNFYIDVQELSDYCPHCGKKMDGDEK